MRRRLIGLALWPARQITGVILDVVLGASDPYFESYISPTDGRRLW